MDRREFNQLQSYNENQAAIKVVLWTIIAIGILSAISCKQKPKNDFIKHDNRITDTLIVDGLSGDGPMLMAIQDGDAQTVSPNDTVMMWRSKTSTGPWRFNPHGIVYDLDTIEYRNAIIRDTTGETGE